MRPLFAKWKHDHVAWQRCYANNRHARWWKDIRRRCLRMAKRAERREAWREINLDFQGKL